MIGLTSRARLNTVFAKATRDYGLILDAGCGSGELLATLHSHSINVIGLDKKIQQLQALKRAMKNLGYSPCLIAADVSNLPFRNETFTAAYCMEVINMFENDDDALLELVRAVKRKGRCTISAPYVDYPTIYDPINKFLTRIGLNHHQLGMWSPGVKRLYKPTKLNSKLQVLGTKPEDLTYIGKWIIPILENYLSLLIYYRVIAVRNMQVTFNPPISRALFNAISKLEDWIIKLDQLPRTHGTHFILTVQKS